MFDIEDIEPELTSSLRWMLENDVSALDQPFTYEFNVFGVNVDQELEKNGSDLIVDEDSKELYITKLYMAKALKESEEQINSFKQGLFEIVPVEPMKMFSTGELAILISGQSEINVADMKQHANLGAFGDDHKLMKWFWEIVEAWDQTQLSSLLFFITGNH